MRANKKVIAIIVVTLVLAIAAVTGVVMYLNDDGTARAGFDGNEPSISAGDNTNVGTEDNNNEDEPNQNPEEPSEETPGDLPVAGEDEENQNQSGTAGTSGTTTNEEDVPNEEYVTERIETVERQISEDLLVGWTPLQINSTYSTTGLGIYKPELSILKVSATSDENNSVSAGDILTYVLAVMNTGSEDANGINISDIIPEQTTLIEESIYGEGTYNVELNKLTWKVNVKAGEVVTVGFAVIVNDNAKGTIKNAGTINGEETQEVLNPVIESSKTSELYRNGELIEGVANIGDQIKYTITVQNTGYVTATANVQDTIPANTKLVSSIVLAGEEIDEETMVNGKDVEIPAGEEVTLTFTVEIEAIDGAIENVATVGDTTPSDKVETANLEIAKTVSTTGEEGTYGENVTLKVGETAYFKIELKNTGSEELQLNVSDLMGETALDLYDGAEKVTELLAIAAGETKVLTATYTMLQSDIDNQTVLVNKVTVTEQDNKVPDDEDTATITPEEKAPSIFVEKTTVSVTPADTAEPQEVTENTKVRPNDVITYSIYVKNDGNVTLHNVKVTDLLDVKYEGTLVEAAKDQALDTIVSLAPGEDKTYTVEYTVTQTDIDKGEPIINTAIATDGTTTGEDDTDEEIPVNPDVTVSGEKTWVDYNNQENTRPESITVEVLNGSEVVDTIEVTASTNWEYTSKALPKYDADNNVITYTVREQTVTGYTATVSGYDITNTLTEVPTVSLVGEKIWNDVNNQDGVRPDNITIVLVSSDENDLTERLVTIGKKADGTYDWTYEFTGLPKYDANNNVISYYVTETGIDTNDYTSVPSNVTTDSNGNFVANITNVHVTEKVTISGTKTWNDANNQDGYRPNSITVKLMNGDTQVAETTAQAPDWTYSFANMDRKANGEVINYTVVEEMSSNANKYTADYTDRTVATNGDITANITNTHTPETVTISGTKTWVGDNSAQRPASIIVKLMNGSTEVTRVTVTPDANGDWKYTFPAQPKFANGNEINYSVEEVSIEGYTSKVTGYNIENTFVKPELTKVKTSTAGEKVNLGDEITYTITTKNTGKTVANSVVITDTVPQYTTLKNGTISDNGTVSGTTITWNVGDLAVGESKSVSFTVTVNSTADVIGEKITNTGYVNGDPTNPVETTVKKDILVSKKEYPVKSIDVVLVLDISSSMNEYSRLRNAKSAACDFIDEMFPTGTSGTGSTVTVVTFNDTATTLGNATSSSTAASLKNKINSISIPEGKGTNIQAALVQTNSVLDSLKNKNKFVVFLGDGAPTPEFVIYGYDEHRKHYEEYVESDYPNNTEAKITAQANSVKAKTTGVYTIGFGMDKLSTSREYWSHYIECTKSNCRDSNHITVNAGDKNRGKSYHWESAKVYATRILKDIIADSATAEKQYYYTADDSVESIVSQFMQVLQSISTTDKTIKAESATVKIPVEGTLNTDKNIIIKIGNTSHECKVSQLPQYGVSYTKTATEEYFTWNISNYVTSKLSIEYTIK